jgi:hypothetical protein
MASQPLRGKVLRIGIVQDEQIVQEQLIRKPENVTVGESTKNTFVLPPCSLPKRFPLFVAKGSSYFLQFTDSMTGKVSFKGAIRSLKDLKATGDAVQRGGTWVLPIQENSRGKVVVDGISVLFQFVPAPLAEARVHMDFRPRFIEDEDPVFFGFLALFAALAASLVIYSHSIELSKVDILLDNPERFADLLVDKDDKEEPKKEEPEEKVPDPNAESEDVQVVEDDEVASEKDVAKVEVTQEEIEIREAQKMEAEDQEVDLIVAQLIGTLGAHNSGDSTPDYFNDLTFQGQDADALLRDASRMESSTSMGVRESASGPREGVEVGEVERGVAASAAVSEGPKVEVVGRVDLGSADIDAVVGEASGVSSVMKRYKGQMKLCYDSALGMDPSLKGRIEIEFSVGRGRVLEAYVSTNTTRNESLANCILRKVKGLTFGSEVEADVVYPFVFSSKQ